MNDPIRDSFLAALRERFGRVVKLEGTQSLFDVGANSRVYLRYSKIHKGQRTFFGLRREDLQRLRGHRSYLCFLWGGQDTPLIIPFADYEDVFDEATPASDGQYKTQILLNEVATELYLARAGRFNVDAYRGWASMNDATSGTAEPTILTHRQIQTLLGAIAAVKSFDVWIPSNDRAGLDWSLARRFRCMRRLPYERRVCTLLEPIDVVWMRRGSNQIAALYEIEQSTPIYSGLLRLNDLHLTMPAIPTLAIVSNEMRRSLFVRQLRRPTFERSGLVDHCTFLEYQDVLQWYRRVAGGRPSHGHGRPTSDT